MRPVVLSGFMATGKTTLGPALARRLGVPFLDTDAEIERRTGSSVPALWKQEGEARFRQREGELVQELLSTETPRVLGFGGGTVTVKRTRRLALDRAVVVTLTASPETILARTPDFSTRPNLAVGNDPLARVRELLEARAEAYAECHLSLSTEGLDVESLVDALVALVERDPLAVPLGTRSYAIDVCRGEPLRLTDAIARCAPSSVVLVTDSNVQRARGAAIEAALGPLAFEGVRVTLPHGERHKTLAAASTVWDAALGAGIDREALVVAVGGGVVGDVAGFAASVMLRGVRVLQVPTTLLSMVDASVGGKTGVDHPTGKNMLGAFHQPSGVVADLAHLETLPVRERRSGLAEVVKIGLTSDAALLDAVEASSAKLAAGDAEALAPIVRAAIATKIRVVRDDEREAGLRALLNLGHTVGHALEAHGHYEKWLHGEAVALGTLAELAVGERLGMTPPDLRKRAEAILGALGLPLHVEPAEMSAAWSYVASDKKRSHGEMRIPVVTAAGVAHVERVKPAALRSALGL